MVELQPSKLAMRVRFPSPAPGSCHCADETASRPRRSAMPARPGPSAQLCIASSQCAPRNLSIIRTPAEAISCPTTLLEHLRGDTRSARNKRRVGRQHARLVSGRRGHCSSPPIYASIWRAGWQALVPSRQARGCAHGGSGISDPDWRQMAERRRRRAVRTHTEADAGGSEAARTARRRSTVFAAEERMDQHVRSPDPIANLDGGRRWNM